LGNSDRINSYQFCKQLARVFGIINCADIGNSLKEMGYVNRELSGAFYKYQITDLGRKLINDNQAIVLQTLKADKYFQDDFRQEMIKKYWSGI